MGFRPKFAVFQPKFVGFWPEFAVFQSRFAGFQAKFVGFHAICRIFVLSCWISGQSCGMLVLICRISAQNRKILDTTPPPRPPSTPTPHCGSRQKLIKPTRPWCSLRQCMNISVSRRQPCKAIAVLLRGAQEEEEG